MSGKRKAADSVGLVRVQKNLSKALTALGLPDLAPEVKRLKRELKTERADRDELQLDYNNLMEAHLVIKATTDKLRKSNAAARLHLNKALASKNLALAELESSDDDLRTLQAAFQMLPDEDSEVEDVGAGSAGAGAAAGSSSSSSSSSPSSSR